MATRPRRSSRRGGGHDARGIEVLLLGDVEGFVGKLQLRAWQVLTSGTPVDKGTARSGWTPTVGRRTTETIRAQETDETTRSAASARFAANQARALAIAAGYKLAHGAVHLANPVPWIVPLNGGSSSQAGAHFVERGIETAVRSFA